MEYNFRMWKHYLHIWKFFYGFQVLLSRRFFKTNKIVEEQEFINRISLDIIGEKIFGKLNLRVQHNSIVLLTGGLSDVGYVKRDVHEKKSAELIKRLGNDRIICKTHPRFDDETNAEKELPHIPSFISMELLMHFFNYFIGYSSDDISDLTVSCKTLSLSSMDLSIGLTGVVLFEQLYRSHRILNHQPYHK